MKTRTTGVTLIELLIAITLLSLLSAGMLMALRVGLNALEKTDSKLMANRRSVSVQRIIRSQIAGFIPVSADCVAGTDLAAVTIPFFQGGPESMRFVSGYSLDEGVRGMPHILEFQVIPGEERRGVRLVVNERPYTGPQSAGAACIGMLPDPETGRGVPQFRPIAIGPSSFVLADKLAYCRFSYRELRPPPVLDLWGPEWKLPEWPTAVRIEMAPLDPDPSRVPLVSVVAPVRVDAHANAQYLY
jgi:prepilin-type N-terminal cleavage/methylation domain-containing protein